MVKYNLRKLEILLILKNVGNGKELTSNQILNHITDNIKISCVCNLLKRYHKWNLVKRKKKDKRYFYILTEKGEKRMNYLIKELYLK